jgi:hypothetical protein
VTGNETWVSFVNIETKEQSKQWMHVFTKQAKKFKHLLSAKKLISKKLEFM